MWRNNPPRLVTQRSRVSPEVDPRSSGPHRVLVLNRYPVQCRGHTGPSDGGDDELTKINAVVGRTGTSSRLRLIVHRVCQVKQTRTRSCSGDQFVSRRRKRAENCRQAAGWTAQQQRSHFCLPSGSGFPFSGLRAPRSACVTSGAVEGKLPERCFQSKSIYSESQFISQCFHCMLVIKQLTAVWQYSRICCQM